MKKKKILRSLEMSSVHNPERHSIVLLKVHTDVGYLIAGILFLIQALLFCFTLLFEDQGVK